MAFGFEDGMTRAKQSCVSLLMPETGLRSVSPRARTPMRPSRRARMMERRIAWKGIGGKTYLMERKQIITLKKKRMRVVRFEIWWYAGASDSA